VYRYSPDGRRELTIGPKFEGSPTLTDPVGLATDALGNLYVMDAGSYFISRYDIPKRPR
jgi:hypothetical protein